MNKAKRMLSKFENPDRSHPVSLIPIRVSVNEIRYLNHLQGGQRIDEETGLREYSPMSQIIRIPEIRELFIESMTSVMKTGKPPQKLLQLADDLEETVPPFEAIPSDRNTKLHKIESYGGGNDKKIVMMPSDVVSFWDILQGGENLDLKMHLQQFGFFDEIVRGVGTVGGFMLGGPAGAGLGNALASKVTGKGLKDSLISGGKNWALGHGVQALGGAMGLGTGSSLLGTLGMGSAGHWGGAGQALGGLGTTATGAGTAAAASSGNAATGAGGEGTLLSGASKYVLPGAALLGGLALTKKGMSQEEGKDRRYREDHEESERKRRNRPTMMTENLNVHSGDPYQERFRERDLKTGGQIQRRRFFQKGGIVGKPVRGKGKGQDDAINVDSTKEGEWIWDASTVSDLGDGSTEAGWKEIRRLETMIRRRPEFKTMYEFHPERAPVRVKTALSNGEYRTPTKIVTAIGNGNNAKGAAILRRMTTAIRRYKNSKGEDLPPPIGDPLKFLNKAIHEEGR